MTHQEEEIAKRAIIFTLNKVRGKATHKEIVKITESFLSGLAAFEKSTGNVKLLLDRLNKRKVKDYGN